jgi:hypothetical protein
MTALALAATLTLAGSLAAPTLAVGEGEGDTPLMDGQYILTGGTALVGRPWDLTTESINLEVRGGIVRVGGSCIPYGSGTVTASADERWAFDLGTISLVGCPGNSAGLSVEVTSALTQADRWHWTTEPDYFGFRSFAVSTPFGELGFEPVRAPMPPTPPDPPAFIPGMFGQWRVESVIHINGTYPQHAGPFTWTVGIEPNRVIYPDGRGTFFTTTASGVFNPAEGRSLPTPAVLIPGIHNEYGRLALGLVNQWIMPDPNTLILAGPTFRAVLARPAPTNRAFEVKEITPGAATVRVAVGQTVKLPVAAEPLAPRARANAELTWQNSAVEVAAVTTGAGKKKGTDSGKLTVGMNTGGMSRVKIVGLQRGSARLTFTTPGGATASVKVIVVAKPKPPKKITIRDYHPNTAEYGGGPRYQMRDDAVQTLKLDAIISPATATGAVPEWTSSAPALASVDASGLVTFAEGAKQAAAPITITATAGKAKAVYTVAPLL